MENWETILDIIDAGINGDAVLCRIYAGALHNHMVIQQKDFDGEALLEHQRKMQRLRDVLHGKNKGAILKIEGEKYV